MAPVISLRLRFPMGFLETSAHPVPNLLSAQRAICISNRQQRCFTYMNLRGSGYAISY
jgi:hypothetical protein